MTNHRFTPGKFSPEKCQVMLARYPCPYPQDQHPPGPPEDIDVFGYRRPTTQEEPMNLTRTTEVRIEPDLRVTAGNFAHPYLSAEDVDPACGNLWRHHLWIDLGMPQYDHIPEPGLTLCPAARTTERTP